VDQKSEVSNAPVKSPVAGQAAGGVETIGNTGPELLAFQLRRAPVTAVGKHPAPTIGLAAPSADAETPVGPPEVLAHDLLERGLYNALCS